MLSEGYVLYIMAKNLRAGKFEGKTFTPSRWYDRYYAYIAATRS